MKLVLKHIDASLAYNNQERQIAATALDGILKRLPPDVRAAFEASRFTVGMRYPSDPLGQTTKAGIYYSEMIREHTAAVENLERAYAEGYRYRLTVYYGFEQRRRLCAKGYRFNSDSKSWTRYFKDAAAADSEVQTLEALSQKRRR